MAEEEKPTFEPNLVLEMATLHTYAPKKGKKNGEGEEIEPPRLLLQFSVPIEQCERYLTALTRVWRKEKSITLGLAFVEQTELFGRRDPIAPAAEKNGHGTAGVADTKPVDIATKRGKKSRAKEGAKA